jgi:hypothetical protein
MGDYPMKKLLILILSLVQAVSVHAMQHNRPMGLKDGNFQEAPKKPGIIQQRFLWSKPHQTAVIPQDGSNNQANIDQNNNNATSKDEALSSDTNSNNTDDEDDYLPLPVIQINPAEIRAGKKPVKQQLLPQPTTSATSSFSEPAKNLPVTASLQNALDAIKKMENNPDRNGESSTQGAERMKNPQSGQWTFKNTIQAAESFAMNLFRASSQEPSSPTSNANDPINKTSEIALDSTVNNNMQNSSISASSGNNSFVKVSQSHRNNEATSDTRSIFATIFHEGDTPDDMRISYMSDGSGNSSFVNVSRSNGDNEVTQKASSRENSIFATIFHEGDTPDDMRISYMSDSSGNSSFVNVSRSNRDNDDDDDTWYKVSPEETKDAVLIHQIEKRLVDLVKSLPADLQTYLKVANLHESSDPIQDLNIARETLWLYITRSENNFADAHTEFISNNLKPCGNFDSKQVYPALGYTADVAKNMPNETFAMLIAKRFAAAETANDTKELWLMRQFGVLFRNELTKRAFDAYLSGPEELGKLKINIDDEHKGILMDRFNDLVAIKADLENILKKRTTNAASTSNNNPSMRTYRPTQDEANNNNNQ